MKRDSSSTSSRPSDSDKGSSDKIKAALKKALANLGDERAWDDLEAVASDVQKPDEVAAAFRKLLAPGLARDLVNRLGQRALRFFEEWYAGETAAVVELLEKILELDASADWALERLTIFRSVNEQWTELLSAYDRVLEGLPDSPRRRRILQDAAAVGRDSGNFARAASYLRALFDIAPGNHEVASELERLLEKLGDHQGLAQVLSRRLGVLSGPEAVDTRERVATLYLDHLHEPAKALDEIDKLLSSPGLADDRVACALAERILGDASLEQALRRRALAILRTRHLQQGRLDALVGALRTAIQFADPGETQALAVEAGDLLERKGDLPAAREQLVELVGLRPDDSPTRARLKFLAEVTAAPEAYVRGLVGAASATKNAGLQVSLWLEAAQIEDAHNAQSAIGLYRQVLASTAAKPEQVLVALRKLSSLLAGKQHADERLGLLEKQAELESEARVRRWLLGEAADVARSLGQVDRALALWEKRLAADPNDAKALDRSIEIHRQAERWNELVAALSRRVAADVPPMVKRADLLQIARIQRDRLQDPGKAIAALDQLLELAPGDAEAEAALLDLFAKVDRWKDLLALGARSTERDQSALVGLFVRLGDACQSKLADPEAAARWYARALAVEPRTPGLRASLQALAEGKVARAAAVEGLLRLATATDDWQAMLALLPHRLELASGDVERARLLREAATLEETRAERPANALTHRLAILKLDPQDIGAEKDVLRLAEATGELVQAAQALEQASANPSLDSMRSVQLLLEAGRLFSDKVDDKAAALACFTRALTAAPSSVAARLGAIRIAGLLADWQTAVDAALADPFDPAMLLDAYLPLLEKAAASAGEQRLRQFGKILSASLARRQGLPPALGRTIEERIADYPVGGDGAAAWKEKALLRARDYDPTNLPTLRRLAEAQQARGGKPLFETLMQIAAQSPRELDRLVEAFEVASRDKKDPAGVRSALSALFDRAAALLRSGQPAAGKSSAQDCLVQAAEGLANLLGASRDKNEIRRVVDYLLEAARLPIAPEAAQSLRARAGELAMEVDKKLARELLRQAVEQDPKNRSAAKALARLFEEADMLSDLMTLRRRELEEAANVEERLALRLDLAHWGELVESRTGRLEMLAANLEDCPGHAATLASLGTLLRSRGRMGELADILSSQARKLEDQKDVAAAAALWNEAAAIFEKQLGDHARAIAAYEKVAGLSADASAMEALATLYQNAGEPLLAANWLEQRLAAGMSGDKVKAACTLADTYRKAGQPHRAVAALERALAEDPTAAELWKMLAGLHREAGHYEPLVRVQTDCARNSHDRETVVAAAREVLAICQEQLHSLAGAVPALERAVALAPDERALHLALADGLRASGEFARARAVLEGLLEGYGRRQSRERSSLHLQIASIARDEKKPELAAKHLDQAAATLFDNMDLQLTIGQVAEERDDWARAEKAYRTLLVLARRGHGGDGAVTAGEVLVRLRRVAMRLDQSAQASEHLEQAIARALHDPVEARKIQAALLADGDHETLLALLAKRRSAAGQVTEEATVTCELAEVLDKIGRSSEALSSLLEVLDRVPDNADAHRLARGIAAKTGAAESYLSAVAAAADKLRRADDAPCVADLLLRAADVAENDLSLLDRAQGFLRRAEQTNRRGAEVASATARVAVKAGDMVEHQRGLGLLRRQLDAAEDPADRADICYRLAEAEMGQEETREDGLAMLSRAVELSPDLPRATNIVRGAQVPDTALARILPVYEKVARSSKDERLLLDFLERKSSLADVRMPELREGVELAASLAEGERAERMLARAIDLAWSSEVGPKEGIWAVADLARRLRGRGDLAGAAKVLERAKDEWSNPRLTALVRDSARAAAASPEHAQVAARLYDELRNLYPTDREIWEPLLSLLAGLGESHALELLSKDLVEKLMSRGDRNTVRMAWAKFLLKRDRDGTADAVSTTLRDVLTEEPGHPDALAMLADLYEQRGEVAEAVSLLSDGLAKSDERAAGRATLARRLGDLVKKADPGQAKSVYRSALSVSLPDAGVKRSLQQALVELLTDASEIAERAGLLEDLLLGETGEGAASQALALFELRLQLGDEAGAERALRFGRERAPGNPQIFDQLGRFYTQRERWSDAVVLLSHEAGRLSDKDKATRLLRKVAHLQREKLGDAKAAAQTLRQAVQIDPSDFDLVRELCDSLAEAQEPAQAVAALGEILAEATAPAVRIGLLRLRAEISARNHHDEAAVKDLEEAILLGATDATADLAAALSRVAGRGVSSGNKDVARAATLRLAEVLRAAGDHDQADQVLFRWIEACPDDRDFLHKMRDIFHAAERWESAANVWARLVHIEEGEAKAEAVLALADACQKLGRPEEAIPWLSSVLTHLPDHPALQSRLASLYAATGNVAEAARLRNALADREPDENQRYLLYVQIGQSLLAAGEGAEATAALEKAVALPPADRATRVLLLDAYLAAGALERAQELVSELLTGAKGMKPDELGALYHRQSRLAALAGDGEGRLQALKKALDADRRSVAIANELADLAESIGDDDLALRALRVVAASPVKDGKVLGQAYLRQARIAHRSKDRARAIIFVKRALQEDPDLEEARALLDQLR